MTEWNRCLGCMEPSEGKGPCACGYDPESAGTPLALRPGTVLKERYPAGRVLGDPGGFGIVYLGWDALLETRVAIKEFLPREHAARNPDRLTVTPHGTRDREAFAFGLGKFLEEARILAKFDHAAVVRVRDFFEANDTAYLVMDHYEGLSLDEYLERQGGRLSESLAANILGPILDGLREVHDKGFLHRDIKPGNIYLTRNGRPVLLDFGAARFAMGERSRSLSVVLTPGYAPFEQYHRKGVQGPWTDVYACGAVLLRMLTGEKPPESIERLEEDRLSLPEGVSETVRRALAAALDMDPARRPRTAREFQDMLAAVPMPGDGSAPSPADSGGGGNAGEAKRGSGGQASAGRPGGTGHGRETGASETGSASGGTGGNSGFRGKWAAALLVLLLVAGAGLWMHSNEKTRRNEEALRQAEIRLREANERAEAAAREEEERRRAEAARVKYGELAILPDVGDAEVYVDGERQGRGTVRLRRTPAGDYAVKVEAAGHHPWTGTATVPADGVEELRVRLRRKEPRPGELTDGPLPGMKFAWIPAGEFWMGSPESEPGRDSDEKRHRVTLTRGFWMQTTEVTVGQWKAFVRETSYRTEAEKGDGAQVFTNGSWQTKADANWKNPYFSQTDDHPVTCVSWNDAGAFVRWINGKGAGEYGLPTEAQWEYAARAGAETAYSFGAGLDCSQANYGNSIVSSECKDTNPGRTMKVGSFPANAWGLHDMHGNVWEWVQDWSGDYPSGSVTDPTGPSTGSYRVLRGGSWIYRARSCRSASRYLSSPGHRGAFLGFRLSRTP